MADTTALKNRIRAAIKANGNQEITGPVLQQALLDMVDELDLNPELENEATTRGDADTRLSNLITGIKNNIDNGYVYAGIAIPTTSPVSGKVFYMAVQAGTYTNFGGTAVTEGITILKYDGASWVKEQVLSDNLVKSGDGPDDFSIQDEAGNILCLWKDGHIKTKNFLSSTLNQVIFDSTNQTTNKANYGTIEDLDQALTPGIFLWKQDGKQAGIVQCFLDNSNHALTQILCTNFQLTDTDNNVLNFTEIADKDYAKKGTFSSHQHTMHTYVRTYGYIDDFANDSNSAQKLEKGWSGWVGLLLDSEWYSNLKLICQSWFKDFSDIIIDAGPDDFSIQDKEGNILCLWKDGNIKTKNFDSQNVGGKAESDSDHIKFKAVDGKGYEQHEYVEKPIPTISFVTPLRYCNASDAAASYTPTTNKFAAAMIVVTSQDVVTIPYLMGIVLDTTDSAYATQGTGDYPITLGLYDSAQKLIGVLDKTTTAQTNKVIDFRKELTLVKSSTTSTYTLTAGSTYYLYIQTQANSSSFTDSSTTDDYVNACKNQINVITIESHVLKDIKAIDANSVDIVDNKIGFDFDIEDENQNILVGLRDGHIKTKNFDSKETLQVIDGLKNSPVYLKEDTIHDFSIQNENGNILCLFKNGHIKTKNFDSSNISANNKEINILFIGNSLTQDAVAYIPLLLKEIAPEIKFKIYDWYNAGRTLLQQYNEFFVTNKACEIFSIFDSNTSTQWENINNTITITDVLENYDFDVVVLQEYSYYDFDETQCKTNFDNCVNFIRDRYKKSLMFVSFMDAPMRSRIETDFTKAKNYCTWHVANSVSQSIIPAGAAVMYAMNTSLDSLGDKGHLSADGTHTQEGLPCLLQSYVVALWIFEKLGVPKSVINSKTRITQAVWDALNPQGPNLGSGVITGTDEQHHIAQECAIKALKLSKKLLLGVYTNFD